MKILWLTNIPSPYRVKFFNELGKHCDLTVLFEKKASVERDDSWKKFNAENFNCVFLRGKSVGVAEAFCPSVVMYLNDKYDHIVVTNFCDPTGILAITVLKIKGIPYEIESDGAFPRTGRGIKERLKKFLLSGAVRYFSTAELHDVYYRLYGASSNQLVRYPFTSVYACDVLDEPICENEKKEIKQYLGVVEKYMILAVGQFIYRKGFDILIKAAEYLNNDYGIYIVGGQVTLDYELIVKEFQLTNIHFIEFKKADDLEKYYKAANVFAHPTREDIWGLVVNEAMAKGLPVITTDRCIAGLELVSSNANGYIIPIENAEALALGIKKAIDNKDMAFESLKKMRKYTIEEMVKKHIEIWSL